MNINKITPETSTSSFGTIITDDSLVFYHQGKEYVANGDNLNFPHIKAALLEQNYDRAIRLMDPQSVLEEIIEDTDLSIKDKVLYYKEDRVNDEIERRLIATLQDGHNNVVPILNLLENLYQNPSKRSREMVYSFIQHRGMPILEDGTFVGYKGVSEDYKDKHSGNWDNIVGTTNKMPRRECDDDPNNHCAAGFHVGSKDYADSWGGRTGHLMAVNWNPKNAVAVPNDHNCEKLRVCEYTVIAEVTDRTVYYDRELYSFDSDGLKEIEGDGIVEQAHSDNYYKIRSVLETARDENETELDAADLRERYPVTKEEFDEVLEEQNCEEHGFSLYLHG